MIPALKSKVGSIDHIAYQLSEQELLKRMSQEQLAQLRKQLYLKKRKQIIQLALMEDNVDFMEFFAENKKINVRNINEDYLIPAQEVEALSCIAFLTSWSMAHITADMWERESNRKLQADPLSATELKKDWSWKILYDQTVMLTSYKGSDTVVYVPHRVGKRKVSRLGEAIFSPWKEHRTEGRKYFMMFGLERVVVPNTVEIMEDSCFADCRSLREIELPNSLTELGGRCFCYCLKLGELNLPPNIKKVHRNAFSGCIYTHVHYSMDSRTSKTINKMKKEK